MVKHQKVSKYYENDCRTISIKVWRHTEIEKIQTEYEKTYALAKSIETIELSAIAEFCPYELIDYSIKEYQNLKTLKIYGLNIESIIFPDNCLNSVEIDSSVVEADDDLKRIKASELILNHYKIDNKIPLGLFSRLGYFNVCDENISVLNEEDIPHYKEKEF